MDDRAGKLDKLGDEQPGQAAGGGATGGAAGADPAGALTGLASAIGQQGGIDGVLDQLRSAGYSRQVDSWISTGENETIPPQQLGAALGDEKVQQLSATSGISIAQLLPLLAAFLPTIVNMLTPHGTTPEGGVNQAAADSGPDLTGMLGGVLGGLGGLAGGAGGTAAGGQGGMPDLGGLLGGLLGGQSQR
jgi:uncharacterized protein YidB (DUF937 family)